MGPPSTKPFDDFNELFANGTPRMFREAIQQGGYGEDYESDKGFIDLESSLGADAVAHWEQHWRDDDGSDRWGGPVLGRALYTAFADAIRDTGHRPLAAIWVPAADAASESVTIHDMGASTLIVVATTQNPGGDTGTNDDERRKVVHPPPEGSP